MENGETGKQLFDQAVAALDTEEYERAIALFSQAIALEPNNAALIQSRGTAYSMENQLDSAIADYTLALEIRPNYANAHLNRGLAYWEKEEHDNAAKDLSSALLIGLDDTGVAAQAHYFLARCYELQGRPDLAYIEYLLVSPDSAYVEEAQERSARIMAEGRVE